MTYNNIEELLNNIMENLRKEKLFDDPFYEEDIIYKLFKEAIISKGDKMTLTDIDTILKEAKDISVMNTLNSLSDKGIIKTLIDKDGGLHYKCDKNYDKMS